MAFNDCFNDQLSDLCNIAEIDDKLYSMCERVEQKLLGICNRAEKNQLACSISQVGGDSAEDNNGGCSSKRLHHQLENDNSTHQNAVCESSPSDPAAKRVRVQNDSEPSTSSAAMGTSTAVSHNGHTKCDSCKIFISSKNFKSHLKSNLHKLNVLKSHSTLRNVQIIDAAFGDRIITYRIKSDSNKPDGGTEFETPELFMSSISQSLFQLLDECLKELTVIKINLNLNADFIQLTKDLTNNFDFQTRNYTLCHGDDIEIIYKLITDEVSSKISTFERKDSGWSLIEILHIDLNVNKFDPLRGSICDDSIMNHSNSLHGSSYIDLPVDIKNKKAVINVQNKDNECFKWAVLSGLFPALNNTNRVSSYKEHKDTLKFNNIPFPVKIKDISKFENLNNISINVFGLEYNTTTKHNTVIGPLHFTKNRKPKHINLLYVANGSNGHYCLIKDLSRLVSTQLTCHNTRTFICDGCLLYFSSAEKLNSHHQADCTHITVNMPTTSLIKDKSGKEVPANILKFKDHNKQMEVPFVVYADFEAFLSPVADVDEHDNLNRERSSYTKNVQQHDVYSFGYYVKCSYDDGLSRYRTYRGADCAKVFIETLVSDVTEICDALYSNTPMNDLSDDEHHRFINSVNCHICAAPLNGDSVRDHDHLTGKFRGAAHSICNINYKVPHHIPIFFHNLSNYDAHFLVHALNFDNGDIELIPLNKEKYVSISKTLKVNNRFVKLRFLDSFRFMSSSLDTLAKNLEVKKFIELRRLFPRDDDFDLLIRKGIYPYELIKSEEDLIKITALPEQKEFYSHLSDTTVSNDDYDHANKVWNHFNCRDMGEYSDLYLKTDVLLLTDVFENFRALCIKTYSLDPAHYFTLPGLSWDAMLKLTKIELELLTDFEMLSFVKKGIRGGLSQCSHRHAEANNKYLPTFDPAIQESYIVYLDANNLYGWAMSKPLPYGEFEWVDVNTDFRVSDTSDVGYILEVDLTYPADLHDKHSDLPFCPEVVPTPTSTENRLLANLHPKEKYIIHYKNLMQCLDHGLVLTKVHRILKFKQVAWLKDYIDLNTSLRAKAVSSFDKDFYKLMNNSVYGKTMENIEKRVNVKLVTHWEAIGKRLGASSLICKPEFHSLAIFSENLVAVQLNKTKLVYNKPIYLGFCILELSKTLMYSFHYDYMRKKYENNIKLMYMDTDSFTYQVFSHDFYSDIRSDLTSRFDTSGYGSNNKFDYPLVNKKEIGFFKDEFNGSIVKEFVGLRSKMYAIDVHDENLITKAKGVNKCVTKKLTMSEYKDCLFNKIRISKEMYRFRSIKHVIYTQKLKKNALSFDDTKRFLIPNSTDTLAWGHYKISSFS